ncbi:MAG TPA: glycosyltransferase family 2 protein [Acetobacteraceae bacterium]|nr:glycosyltransferase family 2 protein [Acetobacteraceae bacterium]
MTVEQCRRTDVAVLLSTHNGAPYLEAQLRSLLAQTYRNWRLYWRDDGSADNTRRLMAEFAAELGPDRSTIVRGNGRIGTAESFLTLLRAAHADGHGITAFADQDDVWLPEKLARGVAALEAAGPNAAALYCARQLLVDATLQRLAVSFPLRRPPGFPAALTQNIATGCTIMLNRRAAALLAASRPPAACMHDWWCYLLIAAAGGMILADREAVVLYRQHENNLIGASASRTRRAIAALRRGPGAFMTVFRQNVAALEEQGELLTPAARQHIATIARALRSGHWRRVAALGLPGFVRQTWLETVLFRIWFLIG